jgi:hypothetical protein
VGSSLPDTFWFRFPVHNQFGIEASKHLGHMAIPANWAVSGKHLGKLLGPQFSPLNRHVVWTKQPRRVIQRLEWRHEVSSVSGGLGNLVNVPLLTTRLRRSHPPDQDPKTERRGRGTQCRSGLLRVQVGVTTSRGIEHEYVCVG